MRKNRTLTPLILLGCIWMIQIACNNHSNKNISDAADTSTISAQGIVIENDTLSAIFASYIALKDALVASDAKLAGDFSNKLSENLKVIHGCENTAILAQELANSNDLALQRSAFSVISEDLIAMFQQVTLNSGEIYVIHCPMYKNKVGADWLSTSSEIENPYFGDEMLTCGTVTQEIK